jgi:prefoldin subunit 5
MTEKLSDLSKRKTAENKLLQAHNALQNLKDQAATLRGQLNAITDDIKLVGVTVSDVTALKKALETIEKA